MKLAGVGTVGEGASLSARLASEHSAVAWGSRQKEHTPKFQAGQVLARLEGDLRGVLVDPRGSAPGFLPDSMASSDARVLSACRHAMHSIADALPSWRPVLDRIQSVVDGTTSRLESLTATIPMLEAHAAKLGDAYRRDEHMTSTLAEERVTRAKVERDQALEQVSRMQRQLSELHGSLEHMEDRVVAAERVSQTLRESNEALVSAFRRGEATAAEADRRAGEMLQEMMGLRKAAEAASEDADQSRQQLKLMRRKIKLLVPKQDLTQAQSLLSATRLELADMKRVAQSHALTAQSHERGGSERHLDSSAELRAVVPFSGGAAAPQE